MAFSGGVFSRLYDWTTDRDNGVKILASRMDQEFDGIATGLSTCILKDGTQTCTAAVPFAEGLTIPDDKTLVFGTDSDVTIQYDETTNNALEIAANVEGAALGVVLKADQGDDNADQWKVNVADGGTLSINSKISGSFVSQLTLTPNATAASSTTAIAGNITVGGTVDGRDLATDGSKLDGIEASADVTDTANVTAAGALMDSEVTNLAQVKAFNSADYATAAQGSTADSALQNVSEDTTPQLGGDVDTNSNNINFADNDKANFGAGNDLQIYHNGSASIIQDTGSGDLFLAGDNNVTITNSDFSENKAKFISNGGAVLYYNNNPTVTVTSTGIETGTVTADGLTVDTDTLHVDAANNRVGISEASPDTKLHLTDHTANAGPVIRLEGNSQNTAGNLLGGIECFNADASGDGPNVVSAIKFLAHSAIDHGGQITFSTHDGTEGGEGSAPVERVRIDQDGKVGIGALPSKVLDVRDNAATGTTTSSNRVALFATNGTGKDAHITFSNLVDSPASIGNRGALYFDYNNTERMRIDSSGNVLVGTTTARTGSDSLSFEAANSLIWFQKNGTATQSQVIFQRDTTGTPTIVGSIQTSGTATSYNTSSDHRLKEAVTDMTGAIARVKQLAPKRFNFIADPDDTTVDGFLAHEAQAVVPEAVTGTHNEVDDDGNAVMQGIDQSKLVPLLTGALKEAITKIETLETKVAALEAGQ